MGFQLARLSVPPLSMGSHFDGKMVTISESMCSVKTIIFIVTWWWAIFLCEPIGHLEVMQNLLIDSKIHAITVGFCSKNYSTSAWTRHDLTAQHQESWSNFRVSAHDSCQDSCYSGGYVEECAFYRINTRVETLCLRRVLLKWFTNIESPDHQNYIVWLVCLANRIN